ncbi:hypothetical protein [Niabella sp.]|uniref:hypothetical protein n=1 Tax=Niabella sp. TaxID=1962976 RepID=UPI002627252B|nr:hypothetical protein [Niabella sp.]
MEVLFRNRGRKVKFRSETGLVQWMRKHDTEYTRNIFEFMEVYKMRKLLFEKKTLSSSSPEDFVSDLIRNNIISVIRK